MQYGDSFDLSSSPKEMNMLVIQMRAGHRCSLPQAPFIPVPLNFNPGEGWTQGYLVYNALQLSRARLKEGEPQTLQEWTLCGVKA